MKTTRCKRVVDMGCGKADIAKHFGPNGNRFEFFNFDHVAIDQRVTVSDIAALPLDDHSADICILSLALWGNQSQCEQYLREAYRVLESNGLLLLVEGATWLTEVPARR